MKNLIFLKKISNSRTLEWSATQIPIIPVSAYKLSGAFIDAAC